MKNEKVALVAFACICIWFLVVDVTSHEKTLSCYPDYTQKDSMVVVCK